MMKSFRLNLSSWSSSAAIAALLLSSSSVMAASCCGGGNSSALVLPKFGKHMMDASYDIENYNGFWNQDGEYVEDPEGADLNQTRLNLGYAYRFAPNWQTNVILPYVWNDNVYPGIESQEHGFGDMALSFWYETFDQVTCVYKVNTFSDLKPAIYFGSTLTIPTGSSAYGEEASNSFEITGRGMYRLDANMVIEKTVYPFNISLTASYGKYLERDVNQEYGRAVKPYKKSLGDRKFISLSAGYTFFLEDLNTITLSGALSDLREDEGKIDGETDPLTSMKKQSAAFTASYASPDLSLILKATWSHAFADDGRGKNFTATDILTLGASYAFY